MYVLSRDAKTDLQKTLAYQGHSLPLTLLNGSIAQEMNVSLPIFKAWHTRTDLCPSSKFFKIVYNIFDRKGHLILNLFTLKIIRVAKFYNNFELRFEI